MLKWVMGVFLIIVTLDDYEKYSLSNLIDIREVSIVENPGAFAKGVQISSDAARMFSCKLH